MVMVIGDLSGSLIVIYTGRMLLKLLAMRPAFEPSSHE
jgi:hypothetical protein